MLSMVIIGTVAVCGKRRTCRLASASSGQLNVGLADRDPPYRRCEPTDTSRGSGSNAYLAQPTGR